MFKISNRLLILALALSFAPVSAQADEVQYIARPAEAVTAFLKLPEQAKKSIDIATFIFEPCHASTQVLLETLAKKAQSGVRVRVLLDSLQQKDPQKQILANYAAKYGMEFRFYNTFELNMRMHIKTMVIDNQSYISGGRNISDEYFGLSEENNYVDSDVLVSGASATKAGALFDELWTSGAKRAGAAVSFTGWQKFCAQTKPAQVEQVRRFVASEGLQALAAVPKRTCSDVQFTSDAPDFSRSIYGNVSDASSEAYMTTARLNRKRASKYVLDFISSTKQKLEVANWIYVPLSKLSDSFKDLRARRVPVEVITNQDMDDGPAFFKEAMGYAIKFYSSRDNTGSQSVKLLSSQGSMAESFALTPKDVAFYLHSKIMVRDQYDVMVSSFNLDSRSYSINLESVVGIKNCAALADDVQVTLGKLRRTYDADSGKIKPKKEASFLAKAFARLAIVFF